MNRDHLGTYRGLAWAIAFQLPVWVLIVLIALALTH
jgi:hypothetical protein